MATGVDLRPAVPGNHHGVPGGDHRVRVAGSGATLRVPGDHRQRDSRRQPRTDRVSHRPGGAGRHGRRGAGHRAALDERQGRRGSDLRPAAGSVRQDSADADRVLHAHTDRLDHISPQQRRHRRPDRGDKHVGQHRQQRDRARHDIGRDVLAAVAADAADPDRAAAVHRAREAASGFGSRTSPDSRWATTPR